MATPPSAPSIRLFVSDDLAPGAQVALDGKQVHYLKNVMRLSAGDALLVFNGRDGEWLARASTLGRSDGTLSVESQNREQVAEPDLWLAFTPIKKTRLDVLIEKAGELGVSRLLPVLTERASVRDVNQGRALSLVTEAAEQCGRMTVPAVDGVRPLADVLRDWPSGRHLLFCDESGAGLPIADAMTTAPRGPWGALIGPEGGFSPTERQAIAAHPCARPVGLGPRLLRADTAAIAALSLLQAHLGDWR